MKDIREIVKGHDVNHQVETLTEMQTLLVEPEVQVKYGGERLRELSFGLADITRMVVELNRG